MAGFSAWGPKDDPKYWMRYKIELDDRVIVESPIKEYSEFEDQYYCRVHLDDPFEVKAEQKIKIWIWISKNQEPGDYTYTWYGTNGSNYETYPNEHMGLFKLEEPGDSGNGTSVYSGQIPEIIYHL